MHVEYEMLFENRDTTIIYQGGSGGFFLFYFMLLSGKFTCGLKGLEKTFSDKNVWQYIIKQYPVKLKHDNSYWKESEFWPDNLTLKNSTTNQKKLFLICNPFFCKDRFDDHKYISNDSKIILLYTDLSTQLRLAYSKNAYWFTDISRKHFHAPVDKKKYLQQIRYNFSVFDNDHVDPNVIEIMDKFKPDSVIKLQNLLYSDKLSSEQQKFKDHWIDLQNKKFLNKLNTPTIKDDVCIH